MRRTASYIVFFVVVAMIFGTHFIMPHTKTAFNQKDTAIVIDAGHGGFDGGAVGRYTAVKEAGLNLAVAKMLKAQFKKAGFEVIMTRENSEALGETKSADMESRRKIIEQSNADIVISVHMNKYGDSAVRGPQVFYFCDSVEGEALAGYIQQELNAALEPPRPRKHKAENYFILRSGKCTCVLVECGFLSNETEEQLLQTKSYQLQCSKAIFEGVKAYLANHAAKKFETIQY